MTIKTKRLLLAFRKAKNEKGKSQLAKTIRKRFRLREGKRLRKKNPTRSIHSRPLAAKGLTSYRYKGNYGWIMIGARNTKDALNEARRSLSYGKPVKSKLQVYKSGKYTSVK
jgi:hypothetical protein